NRSSPARRGGGPRLRKRVVGERLAVLVRQHNTLRQALQAYAGRLEHARHLSHLVRVSRRQDQRPALHAGPQPTAAAVTASSCNSRRASIPPAASASSSSRCARESGVRSAVACTSTSPPSPVITTLASTSAVESSE